MGFSIYYRSTHPVSPARVHAIEQAIEVLCRGRTWLGCEPVGFFPEQEDGYLFGGSKPNFEPHPDDIAAAAQEELPNGTTLDLLDVLCQISREYAIDWEISHDHSDGPVGYIRGGVCDREVFGQLEAFADLGDILDELEDDDDDEPPILPFRPKGE